MRTILVMAAALLLTGTAIAQSSHEPTGRWAFDIVPLDNDEDVEWCKQQPHAGLAYHVTDPNQLFCLVDPSPAPERVQVSR